MVHCSIEIARYLIEPKYLYLILLFNIATCALSAILFSYESASYGS